MVYYRHQLGGGGVNNVFRGAAYQKGHGIGSFLGGMFRTIAPLLKSGAKTLGREALRSGVGFLGDIAAGTTDPKQAAASRFKQLTGQLKHKADNKLDRVLSGGGGVKRRRITRTRKLRIQSGGRRQRRGTRHQKKRTHRVTPQSLARLLRVRTSKRKTKKTKKTKKSSQRRRKIVATRRDIFA